MKAVILAGGFAKRLRKEVLLAQTVPKPLLPLSNTPIIEYILKKIEPVPLESLYILTSLKWKPNFEKWLEPIHSCREITLSVLPFKDEAEDPVAVGGLGWFIQKERIDDDLFIIAGDNLFNGFDVEKFVDYQKQKNAPVIACYNIKDREKAKNYGVVLLMDEKGDITRKGDGEIVCFSEKPGYPRSTLISTACYVYPAHVLDLVTTYLGNKRNPTDAPGHFVQWLCNQEPTYGFVFDGAWFDIGSRESYEKAEEYVKQCQKMERETLKPTGASRLVNR